MKNSGNVLKISYPSVVESEAEERKSEVELFLHLDAVVVNLVDKITATSLSIFVVKWIHLFLSDLFQPLLSQLVDIP